MKLHRVIIWTKSISDFLDGNVYGIGVQLYFWAQTFAHHNWEVTTFTFHESFTQEGIHFCHSTQWGKLEIIHEWVGILWSLIRLRPKLIISRGAGREVFPLVILSKCLGTKYVCLSASDTDFETGKELIAGGPLNRLMWQKAIRLARYIVVQNLYQHDMLKQNYCKDSLILNNIWGHVNTTHADSQPTDVIWIANFRRLKRAEWLLTAAQAMPEYDFTLVGGPYKLEKTYYEEFEKRAKKLPNLHFLGKKSFAETNVIVANSRLLCCTSTFEGFPNTFLQAWANDVPVISTVNPSNLITKYHLGVIVDTEEAFQKQVQELLQNKTIYDEMKQNICEYFIANHAANTSFKKLIEYIEYI